MDISNYTPESVTSYMVSQQLQSKANIPAHIDPTPTKSTTSDTEKALKAWNSSKCLKDSFPILRSDANYHTWRMEFVSEVKVQRMTRLIDQQFNPSTIHDPYDKELLNLQQVYFWTVLSRSFCNPLGITVLPQTDHETPDAISCYFRHQFLQNKSLVHPIQVQTI